MADARDLYQETIIDHYRKPRNFRRIAHASRQAEGSNPLCGDRLSVFLQTENGIIEDISFTGTGCAISIASASLMTDCLNGKTEAEARSMFEEFQRLVTDSEESQPNLAALGALAVFSGVRKYPVRAKCAALAWHTMRAALDGREGTAASK